MHKIKFAKSHFNCVEKSLDMHVTFHFCSVYVYGQGNIKTVVLKERYLLSYHHQNAVHGIM